MRSGGAEYCGKKASAFEGLEPDPLDKVTKLRQYVMKLVEEIVDTEDRH